ncbi:MAG: hypothetical protein ABGY41_20815, partial [Candidatus Poribacteria bacterium]
WPATVGRRTSVESASWRNGAFTQALLGGIANPRTDVDGDGVISELELAMVVARDATLLTDGRQRFCPIQNASVDLPLFAATGLRVESATSP